MCGIAGILQESPATTDRGDAILASFQRSLCHRGPDDHGRFVSPDGHASLVHTRLSILDLTPAGHQPMHTPDGRYSIVFNGEIYNFMELRSELQCGGEVFQTGTDTEVLLRLYAICGPACVNRLRGMFAFAVWDADEKSCFLARDPFGIKPLYYHHVADRLVFASEVTALLDSGVVPRRLNPTGVAAYFRNGTVSEPETLIQDVRCLRAGNALLWKAGRVREYQTGSRPAWSSEPDVPGRSVVAEVRDALMDSVEHHFVSDVPVGIFLSSGIDSTALLALASCGSRKDIRTFCIRFAEQDFDEGELAGRTAAHFGSAHSEWQVDAGTGRVLLKHFLTTLDQPTIDGFNTFIVSKFAHDEGMKVVLSGLGGDELFGGYPSFVNIPKMVKAGRRLAVGPGGRMLGAAMEGLAPKEPWRRLGHFLRGSPDTVGAYQAYRAVFLPADAEWLTLGYTGSLPAAWPERVEMKQPTIGDEVSALELSLYMRNQLLRDSDVMSMAWGLELRVPFVDQKLVARVAAIPAALRLQPGKRLLIQAVPEIPDWVTGQVKRGFAFPFRQWFDSEWQELFRDSASRFGVHSRTWYQKWAIFVFEHWCREHDLN